MRSQTLRCSDEPSAPTQRSLDNLKRNLVFLPPACQAMGTGMMLSSWATSSIEEVAEAAPSGLHWLQLYVYKDREVTKSLVKRAERAGYKGIFLTVDTPFLGRRFDDVRNKFQLPPHLRYMFTGETWEMGSG